MKHGCIELSCVRDPGLDTPLARSALPVLRSLRDNLEGQPISVILTDARGVVLSGLTADHDLELQPGSVQLAPGSSSARVPIRHPSAPVRCGCAGAVRWMRRAPRASGSR